MKIEPNVYSKIAEQFKLDFNSDHGISHWERVEKIGLYLAKHTKADLVIISLFAFLHDSKRENEFEDVLHGYRSAKFVRQLYDEKVLIISKKQLNYLIYACENHSNPKAKSKNITIQTCWDSDRLDLWRVGITPDTAYLSTNFAKTSEAINFSYTLQA